MAQTLKLKKYVTFEATLVCKTGLRIGGTETGMEIAGAEHPVIRDSRGVPYIPGSSLKGKLRSMLEYYYDRVGWQWRRSELVREGGEPCGCGQDIDRCQVCTIFGPHKNDRHQLGPSRIIVRDAFLSEDSVQAWEEARKEGNEFTETKTETMIDRRTGTAARGSLRTQERIPAGTAFQLNIALRVFEGDNESKMKELVRQALDLLNKDYLGGSGTRGYGWVEIKDVTIK